MFRLKVAHRIALHHIIVLSVRFFSAYNRHDDDGGGGGSNDIIIIITIVCDVFPVCFGSWSR